MPPSLCQECSTAAPLSFYTPPLAAMKKLSLVRFCSNGQCKWWLQSEPRLPPLHPLVGYGGYGEGVRETLGPAALGHSQELGVVRWP